MRGCPFGEVLSFCQECLASAEFFLCLLAIVDIAHQAVPADDSAVGVPGRIAANLKPAIGVVEASKPRLEVDQLARLERFVRISTWRGRSSG